MSFNTDRAAHNLCQQGSLIPRACPDFQNAIFRPKLCRLQHGGNNIWLRNSLGAAYGQWAIFVSVLAQVTGDEIFAWNSGKGGEHAFIKNAARLQLMLDHDLPGVHEERQDYSE